MYQNIKSCVSINSNLSKFFLCNCGVRQGENLSPALFSLFLNDLECNLNNNHDGIAIRCNELDIMQKILILLYADDTVILADDPKKLQLCLNSFSEYCKTWKLQVNTNKTKIMIFGSRKKNKYSCKLGNKNLEKVSVYKYLSIYFSSTGSFLTNRKYLVQQATKALYYFYRRVNNLNLPLDLVFKLFDHTIIPILLFSSEVWGYEDHKFLENLHCAFLRKILHLKLSTPHFMLYAETGRFPLEIMIKTRVIAYWSRLITGNQSKIAYKIYQIMIHTTDF